MTREDAENHNRSNRQFFRVDDVMSIEYKVISAVDFHAKKREIHQKQLFEVHDRVPKDSLLRLEPGDFEKKSTLFIARALLQLNHKLDELISLQREGTRDEKMALPVPVVMSASGVRFASSDLLEPGTHLHLVLHLNLIPLKKIDLLSQVVRNVPNKGEKKWGEFSNTVAVKFVDLHDDLQEELVRYVFKIQRDGLRKQEPGSGDA